MRNRRGKLDIPYLAIFSGILIVVLVASPVLFPEWRDSPATMVALLVAAVVGIVGLAANFRQAFIRDKDDAPPAALDYDSPQHRHNQKNVCATMQWIDDVLRESLPEGVRLALALDSSAVMLPRSMVLSSGREPARKVESADDIAEIFGRRGEALLILGAPGSGKTLTLLDLGQLLLLRAEDDPREPVPVVLNLSTWAQQRASLAEWIVDRMWSEYRLNKRVTLAWLAADHLILLLDGLDEVAGDARDACVWAINAFRESHGAGMAVCSRSADYAELRERPALSRAVEIRPLEQSQIDAYLGDERLGLAAVSQAIAQDDALRELATTPLMLNVMAVAYGGWPFAELLPLVDSKNERRAHLYDAYLARVFARRPLATAGYTAAQALRCLRFIAARLTERDETQFFIEDMQPDWLPGRRRHWVGVLFGVLVGALLGVLFGVLLDVLVGALVGALVGLSMAIGAIEPVDELEIDFSPEKILRVIPGVLVVVLDFVLVGVLFGGLVGVPDDGLGVVLVGVLGDVLGVVLVVVLFVVLFGVLGVVLGGVVRPVQSKRRQRPNQGIRRSAANALRGGVLAGVLTGVLFVVLAGVPDDGLDFVLFVVLGDVLFGVLVGVLLYGGEAVIKHYILRLLLALHRLLPLRLIPFLEAMRERILLQRAGAHYRFIHRTFQEHIAALSDERIEALTR